MLLALVVLSTLALTIVLGIRKVSGGYEANTTAGGTRTIADKSKTNAVYEWRDISSMNSATLHSQFSVLSDAGFNTIFLSLDHYIDIADTPDSPARTTNMAHYTAAVANYISAAEHSGIKVQAVAGGKTWADPELLYLSKNLLTFVSRYNVTNSPQNRIRGVVFDVEPYSLPEYTHDRQHTLEDYLMYAQSVYRFRQSIIDQGGLEIPIGFTIPFWLDNETHSVPRITFNGAADFPFYHLARLAANYNGLLIIMSYRNTLAGNDGVFAHSAAELTSASRDGGKTKILIGQEAADVRPSKVTYHSKTTGLLLTNMNKINATYTLQSSYQGVAINDMPSVLAKLTAQSPDNKSLQPQTFLCPGSFCHR